jgi:hypothetical protein
VALTDEYDDTYLLDGWPLSTAAVTIETAEGLQDGPEVTGDLVLLPGLDGAYDPYGGPDQPRPYDGPGRIRFDLSLQGVDPDTGAFLPGDDTAGRYFALVDDLMRRVYRRRVLITHPRPDGDRVAVARLSPGSSVGPAREPSSPWFGRCRLEFVIPGGHWTSTTPVTTGVVSLPTGGTLNLAAFAPATAPCTELLVRFYGASSNPQITTETNRLKWAAVIPAGLQVQHDTATGLVSRGVGPAWATTDGQPGYAGLDYAPGPRLFEVDPSEPLTAVFTHTGGGPAAVEVVGRLRFRTS